MKYTIEGFDQETMVEYGMDCTDAVLLRWFVDFKETGKMVSLINPGQSDGNPYYWVQYKYLIDELPLLKINNKESLYRRLKKIKALDHKVFRNSQGVYSTYRINKEYFSKLIIKSTQKSEPIDSKVDTPIDSKVGTKYSSIRINSSIKDNKFIPPSLQEVTDFCIENGYSVFLANKVFNYYSAGKWRDSRGKQVRNWRQKIIAVWFRPENKEEQKQESVTNTNWGK